MTDPAFGMSLLLLFATVTMTFINLLVLMMVIKMHTEVLKIRELTKKDK